MAVLTAAQFQQTFGATRHRVDAEEPPFDFWPYFDGIPATDFEGHDCSDGVVEVTYRMEPSAYEHVLIRSENRNIFMVIVLDRAAGTVLGHRLLDLNREYGLHS
jgi:hypothetical protein